MLTSNLDVVLEDICEVVGTLENHERVWLRNVFDQSSGNLDTCSNVEAPLKSQADFCTKVVEDNRMDDSNQTSYAVGHYNIRFGFLLPFITYVVIQIMCE